MRIKVCFFLILTALLALPGCSGKDVVLSKKGFDELLKGNDKEAGLKFEKALVFNPENPSALLNLGVVYHRAGRHDKAQRLYEKVIALQPQEKAETSNIPSFIGKSLTQIAEANLTSLKQEHGTEPVSAPIAVLPPEGDDIPVSSQEKETFHPDPEETFYLLRESKMLFEIAARSDVYGDILKWPALYRLNMKEQQEERLLNKPIREGTRLRVVTPEQAMKKADEMGERHWVVNAASVRSVGETIPPAIALMKEGYHVYLSKTELAGEEWIRLRVGFYSSIFEAMAVCEKLEPLMRNVGEPCVLKIEAKEFRRNAGY
jgi:hypothetical protein